MHVRINLSRLLHFRGRSKRAESSSVRSIRRRCFVLSEAFIFEVVHLCLSMFAQDQCVFEMLIRPLCGLQLLFELHIGWLDSIVVNEQLIDLLLERVEFFLNYLVDENEHRAKCAA